MPDKRKYSWGVALMKKIYLFGLAGCVIFICGCVPLIIGGAVGAVGAYAISRDTVQGDTDKAYDSLWDAAYRTAKIRGVIREEDNLRGYLRADINLSRVEINLIKLTQSATRVKIRARRHHLPDLKLAEDFYTKIMDEAR